LRKTAVPRFTKKHINALMNGESKVVTRVRRADIKIEKNIPIPDIKHRGIMYPLLEMDVGDSFAINPNKARSLRGAIHRAQVKTRHKFRFVTRLITEGKKEVVRVWRIS
tara:strand:- start:213 stop:539 length:327 start_codon:yes stop_codon:yes gene_type:complete